MAIFRRVLNLCAILAGLAALAPAAAQAPPDYPNRPLRLIVPFAGGGTTDVLARLIGHHLGLALGQQVVIENRPGVNGNVGTDAAAKSTPDGYTIVLVADGTVAINPGLYPKLPFDPERDLMPISRVALVPLILVAHPSLKAETIPALIALSQEPSASLFFSSAGLGSTGHLAGELLKSRTGLRMTHVNYKGGGQAVNDVVSGQIPLLVTALATAGSFIEAGQLKALAVTSAQRLSGLPNVPTIAESGVKDFDVSSWYGIMAPAGTPAAIIDRLNGELVKALRNDDLRRKMQALGAEPIGDSPNTFAKILTADIKSWGHVISAAKISFQ
ncbi:tripartite tricarboxylate transporter substrate binding protein [Methylocella sp. CPCC 101449]|uniref:Bug family tripartite tricarboxylate transporter substrate binding protein n=1 Tax=Methylocella sp. CPCC 101449 TaxID=2987531 RepID=UPI002892444F|nr:tripartite tricarboxylate transporter substrate binding protein [Methylocella sp. CPCC 101449]MDT2020112.1 tripartite tricarboxylate transporter substrate binding protein [Methylocella sp. CPCC 101449]